MKVQKMDTNFEDMLLSRRHFGGFFAAPEKLPVSYIYGDVKYLGLPKDSAVTRRFIDTNILETVFKGQNGTLSIEAHCLTYRDYPVVEWTVYFSSADVITEILEDVQAADVHFSIQNAMLVYNNGDFYSAEGYTEEKLAFAEGVSYRQSPVGGRPCDHAFPYQRLLSDDGGINIAIGWPGQWSCEYIGRDGVDFRAGQALTHTRLLPGETFRTPRMTLMAFAGDETRGINVWRRFMNAHVTPRSKGRILAPMSTSSDNGGGIEFTSATEHNQLEGINYVQEHLPGVGLWWIDAGWYPCEIGGKQEWWKTGNWRPDPARFPNGLAPVGKACKEAGMELLVWFEPERVWKNSELHENHPEWMLHREDESTSNEYLLDLTNPDCLHWLCETISNLITESGITVYRQDFNFEPEPYWRRNEKPDRRGMVENLYVQGFLAFWDYLLIHHHDLWIDSCASGGRRNDLETLRRSVPLHPTDYGYGYHHVNQAFRHTLYSWIPYTRGWSQSWDKDNIYYNHEDYYAVDEPSLDNFKIVNGFAVLTGFSCPAEMKLLPDSLPYLKKSLETWKAFSYVALHGDFYQLTETHRENTKWTVFQFDLPDRGVGAIQALRNNQSKDESLTVKPFGFSEGSIYEFRNSETGEKLILRGSEVHKGFILTQPVRSGAIWFYERAPRTCLWKSF